MEELCYNKKILNIFYGFLLFFLVIIGRLFYLQIYQGDVFLSRGESNFLRMEVLESPRGNVLDVNGQLLATNRPVFDLYWMGSGKRAFTSKQNKTLELIFDILNKDLKESLSNLSVAEKYSRRFKIKEDISFEQLCQISEQCDDFSNFVVINHFQRVYPYKNVASHILGYVGRPASSSFIGRYGIEKIFQEDLEGEKGYVLHVMNSTGKRLEQRETKQAMAGANVTLTIDKDLQLIAESLFDEGMSGVFLVMDPCDGAIKTLVSYPNFDPNLFIGKVSEEEWRELSSRNSPFLNRAVHALYPPASLFKLVTFAAGLEEGVFEPGMEVDCKGFIRFYGRKYNCIRRFGHGPLSFHDALAYSCNIHCYEIAKKLSVDTLADYARRFGLGQKTNFTIEDKDGLVPTREWKKFAKGEGWWKGETISISIGQSYLQVTPLQIARMISSIFTGNLVKPRILSDDEVEILPLNIKEETLLFLRDAMRSAVKLGTARKLRILKDFTIHAKTGTAQTSSLAKAQLEHGWFACHFSYKDEKPMVLISLVESVGTALPALLLARKFLKDYSSMKANHG